MTIIKTDKMIINFGEGMIISKHNKYPKNDSFYDNGVEYLIGLVTPTKEWETLFRFNNEEDRNIKYNEILEELN